MRWFSKVLAAFAPFALVSPLAMAEPGGAAPPLVVLDPGHGGSNLGAPGAGGVLEKRLTLELCRRLARALEARGVAVRLTRDDDHYLTLRQRSDVANRADAALFVSVHANASRDHSRRGFETYVLSPKALEVDARALRQEPSARPRPGVEPRVAALLDDLERELAQPRAQGLAAALQQALARARPGSPDRGVKKKSMDVLFGATMPAVLVEVGFIDHPVEGRELEKDKVQDAIARELAAAIAAEL